MAKILFVEDDVGVSVIVTELLLVLGNQVVGPVATVNGALELIATEEIDIALLDVKLKTEASFPIALELRKRKIPYAFTSGDQRSISSEFSNDPVLVKPFGAAALENMINRLESSMYTV
jgi:DNA-binding response OmpR family regulator